MPISNVLLELSVNTLPIVSVPVAVLVPVLLAVIVNPPVYVPATTDCPPVALLYSTTNDHVLLAIIGVVLVFCVFNVPDPEVVKVAPVVSV